MIRKTRFSQKLKLRQSLLYYSKFIKNLVIKFMILHTTMLFKANILILFFFTFKVSIIFEKLLIAKVLKVRPNIKYMNGDSK